LNAAEAALLQPGGQRDGNSNGNKDSGGNTRGNDCRDGNNGYSAIEGNSNCNVNTATVMAMATWQRLQKWH
jgi:hypothetical protein